jgi:WXG100 family type VII secretion target
MDHVLSYNFDEIEYTVRQEIHATSARLNAALDDLRAQIAPLQEIWTREAADAYRIEQARWEQAAGALNEILFSLGNAVRDGSDDVAATDRSAANAWDAQRPPQTLCGPAWRGANGTAQFWGYSQAMPSLSRSRCGA